MSFGWTGTRTASPPSPLKRSVVSVVALLLRLLSEYVPSTGPGRVTRPTQQDRDVRGEARFRKRALEGRTSASVTAGQAAGQHQDFALLSSITLACHDSDNQLWTRVSWGLRAADP